MLSQSATHIDSSHRILSAHYRSAAQTQAIGVAAKQNPLHEAIRLMGATISFPSESEVFGEGEAADYVYQVISGGARTYKILSDGRRQVGGFYLPGDIFGLEFRDEHSVSAEAITNTKVVVVKRRMLMTSADRDPVIGRELLNVTGTELRRAQTRMLLLVKSAEERVAGFLLEMAERARGGNVVELPMTRRDIADYLGLTFETVSRTLRSLANKAAIEVVAPRRIVLRNRSALRLLNA
jgi:CRP/FNR family nitrogen fixation transcriptional regulator